MHIPDGYLSPSTCAVLYGGALPFWYVALARFKRSAETQLVPLVSVFAAFSFVIMMFNLPLPGGTTGHAIGIGIASVVLGPSGAILSISIALAIQALFFADGGVTTLGANCFNMGIVGSLVAYGVYRLIAGGSALTSMRRVAAAGLAGYAAINAAAFAAAIEFGIQPLLFHDAAGAPLYCPYPLSISIPAMMLGHLTFAGFAELIVSAGVVHYLQRSNASLLRRTAPRAADLTESFPTATGFHITKAAWVGMGILLMATPLGIIAAGSAWGEWTAEDFIRAGSREAIAAVSGQPLPIAEAPRGLIWLSSVWQAPLARYAPQFAGNASFGYFLSAIFGAGSILLSCVLLNWLFQRLPRRKAVQRGFVEKTVTRLMKAVERSVFAEAIARGPGFLQHVDPRTKLTAVLLFLLAAASVRSIVTLLAIGAAGMVLAKLSNISWRSLAFQAWLPSLGLSGFVALPALFLIPGKQVFYITSLDLGITAPGLSSAGLLLGRVLTASTLVLLLVLTTEWNQVLRALRFVRVPVQVVVILGMTYRYLFVLLRTAHDMFEARSARLVGVLEESDRQRLASASVGILLEKSVALSQEIHLAMLARGFRGEVYLLDEQPMSRKSWMQLGGFATAALVVLWMGARHA